MINKPSSAIKHLVPAIYFLVLSVYWFYDNLSQGYYNYAALGVIAILLVQLFVKNKVLGISIGLLAISGSVLMFLAVLSEFKEFSSFTEAARQLIITGTVLSVTGILMGAIMTRYNWKTRLT